MPSATDLIFVAMLCAIVFTPVSVKLLGDAGIGWHIRTGQQIIATHAVPRVDVFSSTMSGRPWFAWEWLYDVVVGQLDSWFGLNGVVWLTAVAIAAVFAWLFRLLVSRGCNLFVALVFVLLAAAASAIHFLARPHVLSWLFTLSWFEILHSAERGRKRPLWILPPLMLLWVNVHGGFVTGFALLSMFWVEAFYEWQRARSDRIEESLQKIDALKRLRKLTWIGFLCGVASLLNPYGWRLHAHVYSYLSNRFLMNHIDEFQSPNFHGAAQRCFLVLLLLTVAMLVVRGRSLTLSSGLTVLFAIYAGLYASRNIPIASILLVLIIAPLAPCFAIARDFFSRMGTIESDLRGHLWPLVAIVATLLAAGRSMDAHFDPARMPVNAVNHLEAHGVAGPVLSTDYWGGYVIYRTYPKAQVVVDDRHDLYGEEFFRSYLTMMHGERGWELFLRDHPASCLLLPRNGALTSLIVQTPEWKEIYSDEVAIAFERRPRH